MTGKAVSLLACNITNSRLDAVLMRNSLIAMRYAQ